MDPAYIELLKVWGPLSIGWFVAGYLIKFIMDRYDRDIESRTKLATALESLSAIIKEKIGAKTS